MAERARGKSAAQPAKKAAPKAAPAKPAKKAASRAAPAKPAKKAVPGKFAPAKPAVARKAAKKPAGKAPLSPSALPPPSGATWAPAQPGWVPVERPAVPGWTPAPAPRPGPSVQPAPRPATWTEVPTPQAARTGLAFDARTGQWLVRPVGTEPVVDPAAYRRGATRSILLNILLGITLGLAGIFLLAGLVTGIILVAAPDSDAGHWVQDQAAGTESSPGFIILNALLTFTLFGIVPFFWVLGTRVVPWLGTVRFLQLRVRWKDWLLGVALVPVMIAAVWILLVGYTCAVEGCGALDDEPQEGSGLDEMLSNLTWPVVVVVALCAGIGEEILFRGVLQRWLGVWGQGLVFGLAHASNAYPPQVLFAFGLGVVFGYLYKRGWSLVSLMVAHALYDFTLLAIALLYPELG